MTAKNQQGKISFRYPGLN